MRLFAFILFPLLLTAQELPLKLVQTFQLSPGVKGHFDHLAADLKHNRLFLAAEDSHSVLVLNLQSGELIKTIDGMARPHAVLYKSESDRIYVTDGGDGNLEVLDGSTYSKIERVQLLKDADSIGFDQSTGYLYIDNGGGDIGASYSMLSAVDSGANRKISDLHIDGDTLEAMRLDAYRPRLYVNNKAKNEVAVVDRWQNKIVSSWPVTLGKGNVAMALDEPHQRLFVGCRSGQVISFDTNTGKELGAAPIPKGVDDLVYDPGSKRLYAAGDGTAAVLDARDTDHIQPLATVVTGPLGRTALLVPELGRYFVAVPAHENQPASVLVYETAGVKPAARPVETKAYEVKAPVAERLVRETLSAHPDLRKMGLHAVQPGEKESVILANGNATRIGIKTTERDFAAVKDGSTYCAPIEDGAFYNMKMPMFDAAHRHIGILVMEIPFTSAADQHAAITMAENIRAELSAKIVNLDALFSIP